MSNGSAKQKVVQSIKDVTNILVTVSSSPSVDELSAALGLTIFLNKLGKHATAVFSGDIPPAITFLNPDKTFEQTTDSLRDFIIALDKEKADHLRYKLVDDAVKIFITPYRTTISDKDLEFSQGDYNVELVLALNVENSESIDTALTAHGKILHDATVISITAGDVKSGLGSIDWHEGSTSGVSEMIVELINDLKTPKVTLDEQMATALLTGIVAVTERFSNDNTSSTSPFFSWLIDNVPSACSDSSASSTSSALSSDESSLSLAGTSFLTCSISLGLSSVSLSAIFDITSC